jgi:hypothetical protein
MEKIWALIVEASKNREISDNYKDILRRYADAEKSFVETLDEKQKSAYIDLGYLRGDLDIAEQDDFAKYLYMYIREILK